MSIFNHIGKRKIFEHEIIDLSRGCFELKMIQVYTTSDNGHQVFALDTPIGGIGFAPRHLRVDNEFNLRCRKAQNGQYPNLINIGVTDGYYSSFSPESYVFSFTPDTFEKCVSKVLKKVQSDIWDIVQLCPLLNIIDILLLKVDELEKKIKQLTEEIKLLRDPLTGIWF
jgi:hypothetical protein